jgi:RNA polymerase sigma factor (sigma-70 family)
VNVTKPSIHRPRLGTARPAPLREVPGDEHPDQVMGRQILALEAALRTCLRVWPECQAVLAATDARAGRTRHASVDRLERALKVASLTRVSDPGYAIARQRWCEAQALRWQLALTMQGAAKHQARRYAMRRGVAEEDLTQEGLLGLFAAAKRYEPDQNVRFGVYARWWLRAHMTHTVNLARLVRLSSSAQETARNLRKQIREREDAGEGWTLAGLAKDLGIPVDRVTRVLAASESEPVECGRDPDELEPIAKLRDLTSPDPEQCAVRSHERAWLRDTLRTNLAEREREIMARRHAIDRPASTVAMIALDMGLSTERVRQLEHQSLAVLRDVGARCLDVGGARYA